MKMPVMILIYNVFMLVALVLLCPIWIPLMHHREKHRRTFFKRLFMQTIPRKVNRSASDARSRRIWIHALSVGEVLSAEPLVQALSHRYGPDRLVFSASTQTGFETAARVIAPHVSALRHFPYDTIFSVNRSLAVVQPSWVIIVETDIWPNFLYRLKKRRIPVHLVNARLSDRSFRGYQRIGIMMASLLAVFDNICVQTPSDRLRFQKLGVAHEKLATVGNIKFDQAPVCISNHERKRLAQDFNLPDTAPVWVAGSTHEGEEEILCHAYQRVCASGIDALMIVAPRDPGRAEAVCRRFKRSGIDAVTMEQLESLNRSAEVVVIDRIGMLRRLYTLADVAFVGGSLVKAGGHNPLEPASVAKPILFGPHTDDFGWICQSLVAAGGAIRVSNADQLAENVRMLILDNAARLDVGQRAYTVFRNNQGAVERTLAVIRQTDQGGHQ